MFKLTELNRKWWILFAMTSSISMIFIDITVLPVTLPTLQRTLNISHLGLQWIVNAYTLALTVFVLAAGRFGDRFGHRKIFCFGLLFFSLGSILCGLSYYDWWFITARVIQGIGAAMLTPTSASMIFSAFPPSQRGKAIGLYVSVGSVFLALGPFVGGVFSEYLSWRYVFWINIPIALIGFLLTVFTVPKSKGIHRPFDLLGFITSSLGITCVVVAIMEAKNWGWTSPLTFGVLGLGLILMGLLFFIDRRVEDPYLDFSLFKNRNFVGASCAVFANQFLLIVTVFWAIYFQTVFDYSPAQAGLISLIANAPIILVAPLGGHLLDQHGPRIPMAIGFLLIAGSLFWFLQNLENRSIGIILSALIPFGCGVPLVFTPGFATAMAEVAPEKRGLASGTTTMLRQLSATLGLAIMGSLYLTIQSGQFGADLQRNTATASMDPEQFQGLLSKAPVALETLGRLSVETQSFVKQIFLNSTTNAFWAINAVAMVIALIGLFFTLWLIKRKKQPNIDI